jgi:hypothetical protein
MYEFDVHTLCCLYQLDLVWQFYNNRNNRVTGFSHQFLKLFLLYGCRKDTLMLMTHLLLELLLLRISLAFT